MVTDSVKHYHTDRLHIAVGYVTPQVNLEGRETEIFNERDRKLAPPPREQRKARHAAVRKSA